MDIVVATIVGLLAGAHTSTWGMYKDSPHEGFTWRQYIRSIIIGGLTAPFIYHFANLNYTLAADLWLLFGCTYAIERLILEYYKTFLREQDQSKYTIPMQFSVFGKVVKSRAARLSVGAGYAIGIILIGYGLYYLESSKATVNVWWGIFLAGSVGGWVSAIGGAWKDAPIEGFETFKFFRSPSFALGYGVLASFFTQNYFLIALCGIGFTVMTIETYKTFFFPSKPRGKFANTPINFPEMLQKRQKYVPLYVLIWIAVLVTLAIAFMNPRNGFL